ncbi:MAG TPA: signal peptidase I [Terriglobia bacterium]|nr:signal peptidase I [Terriglobia bacterium]
MKTSEHAAASPATPEAPAPQSAPPPEHRRHGEGAWETLRSLFIVLIAVFCIRTFVAEATVIPTGSMENTILIGDHVFLDKLLYGPELPYTPWRLPRLRPIHRGDIVAFHNPRNPSVMFVKRVIAAGGDTIRIVGRQVYVNGQPLKEPYAHYELFAGRDNFPPPVDPATGLAMIRMVDPASPQWAQEMPAFIHNGSLVVPQDHFFAMGDNRDNSDDSRYWGFVPDENVVGEPLFVYWSYDAPTPDWTAESLLARVKFDGSILRNFFQKTRWSRMGKIF